MKANILTLLAACISGGLQAQFYVRPGSTFYIAANTAFTTSGLTLTPNAPLSIQGGLISPNNTPLQSAGGASSINRHYTISPVLNFRGQAQIQYTDAELNGNSESSLKLAFADVYALSIISTGGSIDAVNNRVTRNFSNYTNLGKLTAISQPAGCTNVPSPLGLITVTPPNACPGQTVTCSVTPVANATSYEWTAVSNMTIASGQGANSVNLLVGAGFIGSPVVVRAYNACGNSKDRKTTVNAGSIPAAPLPVSGPQDGLCGAANVSYVVTPVSGVTYNWSFNTPSATISSGQGTNAIMASFNNTPFVNRTVSVTAANGCGVSAPTTLGGLQSVPNTPGAISGASTVCAKQANVAYSFSNSAPSGTTFQWRAPAGSKISDGSATSTTNVLNTSSPSVTVNFGTASGLVRVRAMNACGNSAYTNLSVSVGCGARPGPEAAISALDPVLYPNPTEQELFVDFYAANAGNTRLAVVDALGRVSLSQVKTSAAGDNTQSIDVSRLAPGSYFLLLHHEGDPQQWRMPFVKQ